VFDCFYDFLFKTNYYLRLSIQKIKFQPWTKHRNIDIEHLNTLYSHSSVISCRKLDWMYAGPAGHVNTDEYLTGRAVDKTFEQFKLGGAEPLNLGIFA
jgi:hypothetical protein